MGVVRERRKYTFWGCGEVQDSNSTKYFYNMGCGMSLLRYGIWIFGRSALIVRPAIPVRVLAPEPKSAFKYPGPCTRYI